MKSEMEKKTCILHSPSILKHILGVQDNSGTPQQKHYLWKALTDYKKLFKKKESSHDLLPGEQRLMAESRVWQREANKQTAEAFDH